MLWRVGNTQLHLLGSAHVLMSPAAFFDQEAHLLHEAEVVAFEANFELATPPRQGSYSGVRTLRDDVDALLHEQACALWSELGLASEELDGTRPWNAALRMMNLILVGHGYQHRHGVDSVALNRSRAAGKSVFFLEPPGVGLLAFANGPIHEQVTMLTQVVRHREEGLADIQRLDEAWSHRELSRVGPLYEKCVRQCPRTYAALLDDRNKIWMPKLLRLAKSGKKALAIVGMLHMQGPNNLLALLERAGHKCDLVETDRSATLGEFRQ